MKPLYHRPHLEGILTDDGIVVTDGPDNKYIKTIQNDHMVVIMLREAITLWENNKLDEFIALYVDKEGRRNGFSVEEFIMFKSAKFGEPRTCLSWLNEDLQIAESRKDIENEKLRNIE